MRAFGADSLCGKALTRCATVIRRVSLRRWTRLRRRTRLRRKTLLKRRPRGSKSQTHRRSGPRHPQYRCQLLLPLPADWKARAERVRCRDGYRCRNCGKTQQENGRRLSVDHILPRRWFADHVKADDPANLVSRCASCHGKKTAGAERKLLQGDVIGFQQHLKELGYPVTVTGGPGWVQDRQPS